MEVGRNWEDSNSANLPNNKTTTTEAAALLNVSPRSVTSAKKVHDQGTDELLAAVDAGEVSVSAAAEIATLPEPEQKKTLAQKNQGLLHRRRRQATLSGSGDIYSAKR